MAEPKTLQIPDKSLLAKYLSHDSCDAHVSGLLSLLDTPSTLFPDEIEQDEEVEEEVTKRMSYNEFLDFLRLPRNSQVVQQISGFIASMQIDTFVDIETSSQCVLNFLQDTEDVLAKLDDFSGNDALLDSVGECLEKYVMTKLYHRLFGMGPLDRQRDVELERRLRSLSFLQPQHLDISPSQYSPLTAELAQNELRKMENLKSPRDKLECILSCTQIISKMLNMARGDGSPPGADEIFPVLVLTIVKANPPKLYSNMQFISNFRPTYRMNTELAYCYTHLVAAAYFIESLNASSLSCLTEEQLKIIMSQEADEPGISSSHISPSVTTGTSTSITTHTDCDGRCSDTNARDVEIDDLFSSALLSPNCINAISNENKPAANLQAFPSASSILDVAAVTKSSLFDDGVVNMKDNPSPKTSTKNATEATNYSKTNNIDMSLLDNLGLDDNEGAEIVEAETDNDVRALLASPLSSETTITPAIGTFLKQTSDEEDDDSDLWGHTSQKKLAATLETGNKVQQHRFSYSSYDHYLVRGSPNAVAAVDQNSTDEIDYNTTASNKYQDIEEQPLFG